MPGAEAAVLHLQYATYGRRNSISYLVRPFVKLPPLCPY